MAVIPAQIAPSSEVISTETDSSKRVAAVVSAAVKTKPRRKKARPVVETVVPTGLLDVVSQAVSQEGSSVTAEQIAERAYFIWLSKGRPVGQDEQNWAEAKRDLGDAIVCVT